jgi:hypothetical protein
MGMFLVNVTKTIFQDMADYLKSCRFLPKLNNEIPDKRNATYKERFSSLENLVLIMVSLALSKIDSDQSSRIVAVFCAYGGRK